MNDERLFQVILSPHVSEKSAGLADSKHQHVFKIVPNATKREVRIAVEKIFSVKVKGVNILNMKGKRKGSARRKQPGKRKDWKKAYVTLQKGQDIQFSGTE